MLENTRSLGRVPRILFLRLGSIPDRVGVLAST
jgi:hypothetical protein